MDAGEEIVEKGFSGEFHSARTQILAPHTCLLGKDLMQAILERYHEEQIWSDKVRRRRLTFYDLLTDSALLRSGHCPRTAR